ncbi:MAG: peptidase S8 [Bradymonadales bacterium]|nr:MAG: peptidase S8 [Bradymonadales bacterium]
MGSGVRMAVQRLLACLLGVFFGLLVSFGSFAANSSSSLAAAEVAAEVREAFQRGEPPLRVLLFLEEVGDLSEAYEIEDLDQRRRFVFEQVRDHALESQADLVHFLKSQQQAFRRFYLENAILLKSPSRELVEELERRPDVRRISLDPAWKKSRLPEAGVELQNIVSPIQYIQADRVWRELGATGRGITVAVQDTGVDWKHPLLADQYRGEPNSHDYHWYDAVQTSVLAPSNPCGLASLEPCDDHGHGSHVLGSILGKNGIGVAPAAQWIACRNMDAGEGRPSLYIDCYQFFLAPHPMKGDPFFDGKPELAADIINNSWGCPLEEGCQGFEMNQVFRALHAAGIANIVGSGNEGPACGSVKDLPAAKASLNLVVGALDHRWGGLAFFSSRGPAAFDGGLAPHLVAPGVSIRSSVPGGGTRSMSGTSMATPHMSGALALLWSDQPELRGKLEESYERFFQTAKPMRSQQNCGTVSGQDVPNHSFGYGVIQIWEALTRND